MIFAGARRCLSQAQAAALWLLWIVPMASVVGSACAFFLWSLDVATTKRFEHPWLLYFLPLGGLAIGLVYHYWGKSAEGGNNLILEQIHEPGKGVPRRMAPLILVSTVVTHLLGGSAGREGTAVQMGGSIASGFARFFRLPPHHRRILLMTGIAAGFGAVFGTPVAGAVFALEVLMIGRMQYESLIPCLLAAIVGDWSCHAWGVGHVHYHIDYLSDPNTSGVFPLDAMILAKVAVVGIAAGLVGALFAETTHTMHGVFKKICPYAPLRPVIGGTLIIGLVLLVGTREYLGLGVSSPNANDVTTQSLFRADNIHYWAWAWKILFTAVTLGSGFKGGEVTPLFFIGAALGHALSGIMGGPTDLFAAVGFVAIFAAASNTPLASTIMGIELFGSTHAVYLAVGCFLAYLCSGHSGIYLSQLIGVPKTSLGTVPRHSSLRQLREMRAFAINDALSDLRKRFSFGGRFTSIQWSSPVDSMPPPDDVVTKEIGMVRIYLPPRDRRTMKGIKTIPGSAPLDRQLVEAAHADGIMNAVAHQTNFEYGKGDKVRPLDPEAIRASLTTYVELTGDREQLELFCRKHGDLLGDKMIVYEHLEQWEIHEEELKKDNASVHELKSDTC